MPPANDDLANAITIAGPSGSESGTVVGSTLQNSAFTIDGDTEMVYWGVATVNDGRSVWLKFSNSLTAYITFTISGDYAAEMDAYEFVSGVDYTYAGFWVGTSDGSPVSKIVSVVGGQDYWFSIGNFNWDTEEGTFTLEWEEYVPPPPPANDNYASAESLSGASGSASGTTAGATTETGDTYPTVWYALAVPESGWYLFDFSTVDEVKLYRDVDGTRANAEFIEYGYGSSYPWYLSAGVDYRIAAYDYTNPPGGPFSFSWARRQIPNTATVVYDPTRPVPTIPFGGLVASSSLVRLGLVGGTSEGIRVFDGPSTIGWGLFNGELSPDKMKVVWGEDFRVGGVGTQWKQRVKMSFLDGGNYPTSGFDKITLVDKNIVSQGFDTAASWHPDGTKIVYLYEGKDVYTVDIDGTNDTLIWASGVPVGSALRNVSYSYDGTYLMWTKINFGGAGEIWTALADGSGAAAIVSDSQENAWGEGSCPAWARNSNTLVYRHSRFDATYPNKWRTCNYDGSGATTIYDDTGDEIYLYGRHAWLSDDSAIVTTRWYTSGGHAVARLVTLDPGGGGYTELVGSGYDADYPAVWSTPIVMDGGNEVGWATTDVGWRIYWCWGTYPDDRRYIVSFLEDGSDYRLEHDLKDTSLGSTSNFKGWQWSATN